MKLFAAASAVACVLASPAFAWSGSARAGDYRVTATFDGKSQLQSVALVPEMGVAARPMQLHAWFVDSAGAILAPAPLAAANVNGATPVAFGKAAAVPANAAALVILAQTAGLTRTAATSTPALVAQIALP